MIASSEVGRLDSQWVRVNELSVHTLVSCSRSRDTSLVMVHGLGLSHRYLVPAARCLAAYFNVYVPDLPGFGRSARPPRMYTIEDYTDFLIDWMTVTQLSQAVFLGNSFGCQLIVNLSLRCPDRLTHAILVGPTPDPAAKSLIKQAVRVLLDGTREHPLVLPLVLRDYWRAGLKRLYHGGRLCVFDPVESKLGEMRTPTLIVRGTNDPIVPAKWAARAAQLVGGPVETVQGAAHLVPFSAPAELSQLVTSFVEPERHGDRPIKREMKS